MTRPQHLAPLALALLPCLASADEPAHGYQLEQLAGGGPYLTTTLSNGEFVGIGNLTIAHFAEDGTLIQELHVFPDSVGPSGIFVDPTETFVLACRDDGSTGGMYRVDLAGGPASLVTTFEAPSQVVFESSSSVLLVSGDGFGNWWLRRLDLQTGQATTKSTTFQGVTVSIDLDQAGNLYVAHAPGLAGNSGIERFAASVVGGPQLLAPKTGIVVQQGLDSLRALQVSPDGKTFYAVEAPSLEDARLLELRQQAEPRLMATIDWPQNVSSLQLRTPGAPGVGVFGQPVLSGELIYQTSPSGVYQRTRVTAVRGGLPIE
jgi:hypothetical protein